MPGTGKTTVSNKLKRIIKHSLIIERNSIKEWINDFIDSEFEESLIYKIMINSSNISLANGYSVIIDSAGWKKEYCSNFKKISRKNNAIFISIRLVCKPQTSYMRTQSRKLEYIWSKKRLKNFGNIFEKIPTDITINSDSNSSNKILEIICKKINLKI